MKNFPLFFDQVVTDFVKNRAGNLRLAISLSLLWLCGCCGFDVCPYDCYAPCAANSGCYPGSHYACENFYGCESYCGTEYTAEDWMCYDSLPRPIRRPVMRRYYPKRRPFQSRKVVDDFNNFKPVRKIRSQSVNQCYDNQCCDSLCCDTGCCAIEPSCVAPASCEAPPCCPAPECCDESECCIASPGCAVPARCIEAPCCTAPANCAAPSGCAAPYSCTQTTSNYQFPQYTNNAADAEPGYMYEGDIYQPNLPSVWVEHEAKNVSHEVFIELPTPTSHTQRNHTSTKKPNAFPASPIKKVPAPLKRVSKAEGDSFLPPLVPPAR